MPTLTPPWIVVPMLAGLALAPAVAGAQTEAAAPVELRQLASRLAVGLPSSGESLRLAVIPLADGPAGATTRVATEVTERLRSAFELELQAAKRPIDIVGTAEIDRAARDLQIAQPLGIDGAVLVGVVVDADYVVLGSLRRREDGTPGRLSVELLQVATRRRQQAATVELDRGDAAGADQVEAGSNAVLASVTRTSGLTSRRILINGGFVAAAAATLMAVSKERQLRVSRDRLLELPAGAEDEWNLEFEQAQQLQQKRNLWLGAAIGAGGATLAYMLLSAAHDDERAQRVPMPLPGEWSLRIDAARPGLSLAAAF